jgi:hypothetical protein
LIPGCKLCVDEEFELHGNDDVEMGESSYAWLTTDLVSLKMSKKADDNTKMIE